MLPKPQQAESLAQHFTPRGTARREADLRLLHRDRELDAARRVSEALFQHLTPDDVAIRAVSLPITRQNNWFFDTPSGIAESKQEPPSRGIRVLPARCSVPASRL